MAHSQTSSLPWWKIALLFPKLPLPRYLALVGILSGLITTPCLLPFALQVVLKRTWAWYWKEGKDVWGAAVLRHLRILTVSPVICRTCFSFFFFFFLGALLSTLEGSECPYIRAEQSLRGLGLATVAAEWSSVTGLAFLKDEHIWLLRFPRQAHSCQHDPRTSHSGIWACYWKGLSPGHTH